MAFGLYVLTREILSSIPKDSVVPHCSALSNEVTTLLIIPLPYAFVMNSERGATIAACTLNIDPFLGCGTRFSAVRLFDFLHFKQQLLL